MTGSEKKGVCNGCIAKCEGHALAVIAATFAAISSTAVEVPDPNPVLPGTVVRTVEVYPGAEKNKAFPLEQGGGMCDLFLDPVAPWQIRSSWIEMRDDQTLWRKVNDCEYQMSYGYAPNEYVVIKGDLYKPSSGSGNVVVKLPEFMVTVPKVDLNWAAKHGDAAREEAEDLIPAAILVSSDQADFGSLVVHGPKDDFNISSPDVTLSWNNAGKVKVWDGASEIHSGHKFSIMQGAAKTLSVQALDPAVDVKFTLEGEPDNVSGERAVDYVHACCGNCTFIAYVDQPGDGGDADVREGIADVGHAFWELRTDLTASCFENRYHRYLNCRMGLYPRDMLPIFGNKAGCFALPDGGHSADVTCDWQISLEHFIKGLKYCLSLEQGVVGAKIYYNLETFNCASATIDAAASCGVVLPRNVRVFSPTQRSGVCPGQLGEDIRNILAERLR